METIATLFRWTWNVMVFMVMISVLTLQLAWWFCVVVPLRLVGVLKTPE